MTGLIDFPGDEASESGHSALKAENLATIVQSYDLPVLAHLKDIRVETCAYPNLDVLHELKASKAKFKEEIRAKV